MTVGISFCRDLESFGRLELSLVDSREDGAGEDTGATGRYCDEYFLENRKREFHILDVLCMESAIKNSDFEDLAWSEDEETLVDSSHSTKRGRCK